MKEKKHVIPNWAAIHKMSDEQLKSVNVADVSLEYGASIKNLRYMASKGCNLNQLDTTGTGFSILHDAARGAASLGASGEEINWFKVLIKYSKELALDFNVVGDGKNGYICWKDYTPLLCAVFAVSEYEFEFGNNVENLSYVIDVFLEQGVDVTAQTAQKETLLHIPELLSETQINKIIEMGANVNALSHEKSTPLSNCVDVFPLPTQFKALLKHGACSGHGALRYLHRRSVLESAKAKEEDCKDEFKSDYQKIVKILEKIKADRSQLIDAVLDNDQEKIKKLNDDGVDVDGRCEFGRTPLMDIIMSEKGELKHCIMLVNIGADLAAKDVVGNTVVLYAALMQKPLICQYFIKTKQLIPNQKNMDGQTPLMACVSRNFMRPNVFVEGWQCNLELAKYLIKNGNNPSDTDLEGVTVLEYAEDCGFDDKPSGALLDLLQQNNNNQEAVERPTKRMFGGSGE